MLTDWRVKVRVAIGSFENLPIPRRLVMTPCGEVAGFDSENSVPSSVPASHGYRFTVSDARHSACASRRDSPETPHEPVRARSDHGEQGDPGMIGGERHAVDGGRAGGT